MLEAELCFWVKRQIDPNSKSRIGDCILHSLKQGGQNCGKLEWSLLARQYTSVVFISGGQSPKKWGDSCSAVLAFPGKTV